MLERLRLYHSILLYEVISTTRGFSVGALFPSRRSVAVRMSPFRNSGEGIVFILLSLLSFILEFTGLRTGLVALTAFLL